MNRESSFFHFVLAGLTGVLLVSLAFGSGFVVAYFQTELAEPAIPSAHPPPTTLSGFSGPVGIFEEAWSLIGRDFYGPLPSNNGRIYGAIRGLLSTLDDPYTVFVEPIPHRFDQDDLRGSYGGVGMALSHNAEGDVVLSPFRGSPAAQAGILEGDILAAVDGLPITSEMDVSQDVVAHIRGAVGTDVDLTIRRGTQTLTFTVTRQVIEIPSVDWRLIESASQPLGYLHISSFTDRTAEELDEGLKELLAGGARGLVLDLQGNGGGLLQAAIDVTDRFLDGGVVLYERRKGQEEKAYRADKGGPATEVPLVVLVNHGTASASEIVAGAIQDRGRGALIGETTFGKGSVQLIFDLSDGSSLHVTAARWYTPERHQLDGVGLTPDVVVESSQDSSADAPLKRAIIFLQNNE